MKFQSGIVTPKSLIVTIDNRVYNVQSDHPNVARLHEAYKAGSVEDFIQAFDVKQSVTKYIEDGGNVDSGVSVVGDQILYNGEPIHNCAVEAIQRMLSEGFDIKPMVKFLERLMECPSYNSVKDMWRFIEAMGLTITEDGCFLAYKSVNHDYTDKYSGTIDNTPGQKPKRMQRSQVDDNPNNHCSKGYHVGALGYAGPDGWYHGCNDKVLICKIDPADVVSVPNDHSSQKLRCCYYEPVGEFVGELNASVYSGNVGADYTSMPVTPTFSSRIVDVDNLLEGEFYTGFYTKADGTCSRRWFLVDEVCSNNYTVELAGPEDNSGGYRSFFKDKLSQVELWDGSDWEYDDEDEDDYEEEVCDCDDCQRRDDCDGCYGDTDCDACGDYW